MDAHQRAMWRRMNGRLDDYGSGLPDLATLVRELRGLFVEADPHDIVLRDEFESHWTEIDAEHELRTEPWAPAGLASEERLLQSTAALREWIKVVLTDEQSQA